MRLHSILGGAVLALVLMSSLCQGALSDGDQGHALTDYKGTLQILAVDDWRNASAPRGDTVYLLMAPKVHFTLNVTDVELPGGLYSGASVTVRGYVSNGQLVVASLELAPAAAAGR